MPGAVSEDRGVIILVSSNSHSEGQAGQTGYAASKGGVASLALPMARDLARYGIRVVAIAPSLFSTNMALATPPKAKAAMLLNTEFPPRFGRAPEFAHLCQSIFENSMLNGCVIVRPASSRPSFPCTDPYEAIGRCASARPRCDGAESRQTGAVRLQKL
jgi:NAD(P)-dependent dehydrogenase (short-subunit alcohol dehydrogenase family)